jgi:hypothetical protein
LKLNRRSWFAAITAPFAARFLPKRALAGIPDHSLDNLNSAMNATLKTLAALNAEARSLSDNFFVETPMMNLLRQRKQDGAYIPFDGGLSIGQPLYYSRGMDPACADKSYSSLTIHNPLNLPVREDGANQCH